MYTTLHTATRRLVALLALAAMGIATAACGDDAPAAAPTTIAPTTIASTTVPTTAAPSTTVAVSVDPATATVVYQFHDSSVAPEYHRSYTVTVSQGEATVVVDSYGDVLHEVTEPIDDALWQRTLDAAMALAGMESVPNDGCSGGTADELTVLDGEQAEVVQIFIDNCASGAGATLEAVVSDVLPLFDMDTLLATA